MKGWNLESCYNILGSWQLQSVEILTDVTIDWDPGYYIIESRELQWNKWYLDRYIRSGES